MIWQWRWHIPGPVSNGWATWSSEARLGIQQHDHQQEHVCLPHGGAWMESATHPSTTALSRKEAVCFHSIHNIGPILLAGLPTRWTVQLAPALGSRDHSIWIMCVRCTGQSWDALLVMDYSKRCLLADLGKVNQSGTKKEHQKHWCQRHIYNKHWMFSDHQCWNYLSEAMFFLWLQNKSFCRDHG